MKTGKMEKERPKESERVCEKGKTDRRTEREREKGKEKEAEERERERKQGRITEKERV